MELFRDKLERSGAGLRPSPTLPPRACVPPRNDGIPVPPLWAASQGHHLCPHHNSLLPVQRADCHLPDPSHLQNEQLQQN